MEEIIFLEPIYKDYIWGGTRLKNQFNKNTPYKITAESWEISSNKNGNCKILNENLKNMTLKDLFENENLKEKIFGKKCTKMKEFPILIKFIDAKQNLSVQVHPNDEYAKSKGYSNGKTEIWYIMDCDKNSKIIAGLNETVNKKELLEIINENKIRNILKYHEIEKGDVLQINPGTIHAIMAGTLICEIQQNCDITYRVYDWDRIGKDGKLRELHIEDAINTIDSKINVQIEKTNLKDNQIICNNKYFKVEKIISENSSEGRTDGDTFYAMSVVSGEGTIKINEKHYNLNCGQSFLISANNVKYTINGKLEILKTSIN